MFTTILAIIKAIPAIKSLIDQFVVEYVGWEIAGMQSAIKDAIKKAIETHDQIPLEHAINSPNAGEHSSSPNTVVRDHIPGI